MYKDITEIEAKKEELRKALTKKEDEIATLWDTLFNPPQPKLETPTQKAIHYAHTAAGLLDGAMLGWKLYRRLNGVFSFGKRKRK